MSKTKPTDSTFTKEEQAKMKEIVKDIVDKAPKLSEEAKQQLARLLRP